MRSPRRILPYSTSRTAYVEYEPGVIGAANETIRLIKQSAPWMHVEHIGSTAVPGCAGKGIVDPLAAILSAGMMLDHLEQADAARAVAAGVAAVLADGRVRTPDLGGAQGTAEVTEAVVERV